MLTNVGDRNLSSKAVYALTLLFSSQCLAMQSGNGEIVNLRGLHQRGVQARLAQIQAREQAQLQADEILLQAIIAKARNDQKSIMEEAEKFEDGSYQLYLIHNSFERDSYFRQKSKIIQNIQTLYGSEANVHLGEFRTGSWFEGGGEILPIVTLTWDGREHSDDLTPEYFTKWVAENYF